MRPTLLLPAVLLSLPIALAAIAQEAPASEPAADTTAPADPDAPVLDSPRAVMQSFLAAMNPPDGRDADFKAATQALDLSRSRPSDARERADALYQVLNRIEFIDLATLPGAHDVLEREISSFKYFPPADPAHAGYRNWVNRVGEPDGEIVIAAVADGRWRFTADTVGDIPALFRQSRLLDLVAGREFSTTSAWLESKLPPSLVGGGFLTLKFWQWLAIFVVILIGMMIDTVVRLLVRLVIGRLLRGERIDEQRKETIRLTLRPFGFLAAALFWLLTLRFIGLDELSLPYRILNGALTLFVTVMTALALWRVVDVGAEYSVGKAQGTSTKIDDVLIPLLSKTLKVFIGVMGVIYACNALSIPIGPLLASFGIAGVAFSFAAKDTVENFFGSIAVLLDRPFDVGDWVVIDDVEGIVEEVGFRSTRVRTFYNSQITVPNANLVRAKVDNYGRRTYRRWRTHLGVQYDTTPDRLVAFCEGIRELIRTHPYTRKDYYQVYCNEFADSSLNILLYMFFEVPDWNTELRERDRLFLDILRLADSLGVRFAFPTTTVHLYKEDAAAAPTPLEPPRSMTERRAMVSGIRAAHVLTANQPWSGQKPDPVAITGTRTDIAYDDAGNPIEEEETEAEKKDPGGV